jgi:hypothetical protein
MSVYTASDLENVISNLTKNNFNASLWDTRQEAIDHILTLIPENSTIGVGGSWTIQQLGILETLDTQGHRILNHNKPGTTPEQALLIRHGQLVADVFLTSTNALTKDGKIVNTDGVGNRVAAMIFGPKRVIIVAGVNKIVEDVPKAEERIQTTAAPLNNKRLGRPNPCVETGRCMDCQLPTRICNVTTILSKRPVLTDIHVIVINEELGF